MQGSSESHQALLSLKNENASLHNELSVSVAKWTSQLESAHTKLARSSLDLKTLHGKSSKLRKAVMHSKEQKEHAVATIKQKILKKRSIHQLMYKGFFTEETPNVVRLLVKAGCSRNYISEVISAVLKSAGITTVGTISRPSISRILRVGYFSAQIQLHFKIIQRNKSHEPLGFNHHGMDKVKRLLQTGRTLLKKLLTSTMRVLLESALVVFLNLLIFLLE